MDERIRSDDELLRDALGCLHPHATLVPYIRSWWDRCPHVDCDRHRPYAGYCGDRPACVGYWHVCTLADTAWRDRTWDTPDRAVADLIAAGWSAVQAWPLPTDPRERIACWYELVHLPTRAAADARARAIAEEWHDAQPCYIRFGRSPQGSRSRNYRDGCAEAGISAFHGLRLPDGRVRVQLGTNQELGTLLSLSDRPCYIIVGHEIGIGSDGEPILADTRAIRRATYCGTI